MAGSDSLIAIVIITAHVDKGPSTSTALFRGCVLSGGRFDSSSSSIQAILARVMDPNDYPDVMDPGLHNNGACLP